MKPVTSPACILLAILLAGCGSQETKPPAAAAAEHLPVVRVAAEESRETILLVSLDDGSVIMQSIRTGADICFKQNSDSTTTCLTRGQPVVDPHTNSVIGFEMIEEQIELIGKSR